MIPFSTLNNTVSSQIGKLASSLSNLRVLNNCDCSILRQIECSSDPGLQKAREIVRRIRKRDLYHLAYARALPLSNQPLKAVTDSP